MINIDQYAIPYFRRSESSQEMRSRPLEWTMATLIILLPIMSPYTLVGEAQSGTTPPTLTFLPLDLGLAAIVVLGAPLLLRKAHTRQLPLPCVLLVALTALTFLAILVNPTLAGLQVGLRMGAVVVVVFVMSELGPRLLSGPVLYAFMAVGIEQSVLAVGQVLAGQGLGLTVLGVGDLASEPLIPFGGVPSARGTFLHPYILAGFAVVISTVILSRTLLVQRWRWLSWTVTAVVAVPLGLTYSRMSVLAVVTLSIVLLAVRRMRHRNAVALTALLLGALIAGLCTVDGWIARGRQTLSTGGAGDADALTSGRLTFVHQAWGLIEQAPIFGVGPSNYLEAVGRDNPDLATLYHVHNVPLLVAAESGVVAGLLFLGLLVSLAVAALRSGPAARSILFGLMPFLLLDHFSYSRVQGLVLFGLWAGAVLGIGKIESRCGPQTELVKDGRC